MADITMCSGKKVDGRICAKRDSCYLFKAIPTPEWQSYFKDAPFYGRKSNLCEWYWHTSASEDGT